MSIASTVLSAVKGAFPESVVSLRYSGNNDDLEGSIDSAFTVGLERIRAVTEEGNVDGADGNVRYLTSDEPEGWATETSGKPAIVGQVVEIKFYNESKWTRFRVATRMPIEGAIRLNLIAEFEEV